MNAIFLHFAGCDLGDAEIPKEREQVHAQANAMTFGPALAALAFGDDLILPQEEIGRLLERLLGFEEASGVLAAQAQIPVFCDLLR